MWRPKSLVWDSEMEVNSVEEEVRECVRGHLRYVIEGPLWVSVLAFLVPGDVLCMRTNTVRWKIAGLYGAFADLFFFLLKKDGKKNPPSIRVAKFAVRLYR